VLVVVTDASSQPLTNTGTVANGNIVLGLQTKLDPTRLDSGTTTSVSTLVVNDTSKSWTADQWVGKVVVSTGGGVAVYGTITTNTTTSATVSAWKKVSDNTSATAPTGTVAYTISVSPFSASGLGLAPIGAAVTVKTPTTVNIPVWASISLKPNYSATTEQAAIQTALADYFASLSVGEDVVYKRIQAALFSAEGVANVSSLFIQTGSNTSDVTITSGLSGTTPQVATLGTVTISVA
jgi:hypothetical protein